jgi:hypothetical protein
VVAAGASREDPEQAARMQAQNAELRRRLCQMQAERDAAMLLCRQYYQVLGNSDVLGVVSVACDGQQQQGAGGEGAAAPAAPVAGAGGQQ